MVLDAALELFVAHGVAETSMEMIARAAGVTRPVIYACYPSKDALFEALIEREQQRLLENAVAALPAQPTLEDTEALLAEGFTALLRAAASAPNSYRLLFMGEHGAYPEALKRGAAGRQFVTERIRALAEMVLTARGGKGDIDRQSRLIAYLLVGLAEGGVRLMLSSPGEWTAEELGALLGRLTAPAERLIAEAAPARPQR